MSASGLALLVDLTLRGALATGALLGLDFLVGRWLAARHRRWLWLLAPIAFLLPIWCRLPVLPAAAGPAMKAMAAPGISDEQRPATVRGGAVSWGGVREPAALLWMAGVLVGTIVVATRTLRASRLWGASRFSTDPKLLDLLEDCRRLAEVRAPIGVIVSDRVASPALLGWLRPKLLLPASWVESASPAQLRDVLLHELAHLRAGDLAWGWLFTAARVLHWFNPLAHVAARRWQAAREDAADEFVLRLRPASADSYDETLLAFLESARRPQPFGALGISENLLNLKHRIQMIQTHPRRVLPSVVACLLLGLATSLILVQATRAESSEADRKTAAVAAMTAWLQGIDQGGYAQSWSAASKNFRAAVTQEQWVAMSRQVREPLGACTKRELVSVLLQNGVPQPGGKSLPGEFAIAQFKTSFANLFSAVETVTFEREADGVWRASGYYIKPG
ncbi:MAG TPA: M56 family metallopeptidase [Chthoniobacterales bacterium]